MILDMGNFPANDGKIASLWLLVEEPQVSPLKITRVQTEHQLLKVKLQRDLSYEDHKKERYELSFELPPGFPVGDYQYPNFINLKIDTNDPRIIELPIKIKARPY